MDHSASLLQLVFCQVPSPRHCAEGLPSSSPFLSVITSFCCDNLLSRCLLTMKAARVAIPFVSLGSFTRLCCQHLVHASRVLLNLSTVTAISALFPLTCCISSASSCIPYSMGDPFCCLLMTLLHTLLNVCSPLLTCGDTVAGDTAPMPVAGSQSVAAARPMPVRGTPTSFKVILYTACSTKVLFGITCCY